MSAQVLAVFVGTPRSHVREDAKRGPQTWETAIFKSLVSGPIAVGPEHMAGDAVANTQAHGGPDRVVLAYAASHYPCWEDDFPGQAFAYGAFGENLTVSGYDEDSVCIGDVFEVGGVRLQVTLPRVPCTKIEWRNNCKGLLAQVQATARIGWFHRVLVPGTLEAGQTLTLVDRPTPEWSARRAYETYMGLKAGDAAVIEAALTLAEVPGLGEGWRNNLRERCAKLTHHSAP